MPTWEASLKFFISTIYQVFNAIEAVRFGTPLQYLHAVQPEGCKLKADPPPNSIALRPYALRACAPGAKGDNSANFTHYAPHRFATFLLAHALRGPTPMCVLCSTLHFISHNHSNNTKYVFNSMFGIPLKYMFVSSLKSWTNTRCN